ncbi:MAG: tripartite tricarboxylate transporter substrate binding protein [Alphaproteobacteria bacterium]|nr:MAG: tripartite tricarboxylate transporter substrate binding protein [Alphaproteobacteria bacterium]TMJ70871.1 MAG: tripartite tricarboxylate transporter substrate binding protein [Alphaproteobacteria bacterium]
MRRLLRAAAAAAVAMVVCAPAAAQDYPTRSITLIVPYPAGGGVDALARVVAEKFSVALGQQVVVDNRAGGSALVGTRAVIKSPPDGYTLFLGHTGSIAINPNLYTNAGFDPRKDFAPIGLIASMQVVLLAHPSFPASTIGEVVVVAKQSGAQLNIGTPPAGTGGYLTAELFKSVTGIDATIIPFKGTAQLMNDLLGNHVPIAFGVLPPALGNLQAGTLRAIAVLGPTRFSLLPDVPTANESGLPGFESVLHYGLLAPASTPRPIIERLNGALRALVGSEEAKQRILAEGGEPLTSTPEEYAKDIDNEERKWGTLVRKLNLKIE